MSGPHPKESKEPRAKTTPGHQWPLWLAGVLIAALSWIAFGAITTHDFVTFDDGDYVYDNPHVTSGLTGQNVRWAFTKVYAANWHPLTWISHMLDCQLFGVNAGGHHAMNLALHSLMAILLFVLLRQMTGFYGRSLFIAILFAIHPLRVESVAWVSERKDVLSGLFFVLTLIAYTAYAKKPSPARYATSLALFALGLMAKPMLVTVPAILLLLDYWPLRRMSEPTPGGRSIFGIYFSKRLAIEKLPFIALAIASCLVTILAQKTALQTVASVPLPFRFENAALTLVTYLEQWIYPVRLAVFYPLSAIGVTHWKVFLALIFAAGITVGTLLAGRRRPYLPVGWFWYLITLSPVIGIIQVGSQAHADRYTYLPQIGIAIAVVWLINDLTRTWRLRRPLLGGGAVVVIAVALFLTRQQVPSWKNGETLWKHALAVTSGNFLAHNNLGILYASRGDLKGGLREFQASVAANATYADPINNIGVFYLKTGQPAEAVGYFRRVIALKREDATLYVNLGRALYQTGRADEASENFARAAELEPENFETEFNLAESLSRDGKALEAIAHAQIAVKLKPQAADAQFLLGNLYLAQRQFESAARSFQLATEIAPANMRYRNNLAIAYTQGGKPEQSIAQYRLALEIDPNSAEVHYNLASTLLRIGRTDEAVAEFLRALELNPQYPAAHSKLASALIAKGSLNEAVAHYEQAIGQDPRSVDALNNLAWLLATSRDGKIRNGARSAQLAEQANALTGGKEPAVLDTLAAAYAESGHFDQAVATVASAIALIKNAKSAEKLRSKLGAYQSHRPWRE